ncbi:hypothetical protein BC941DRAFT_507314 [Chlamydoabsidia padenii]|nr:hypothetical protein BC941DRAFT_507314 [Chlamydoabsidia padenii]
MLYFRPDTITSFSVHTCVWDFYISVTSDYHNEATILQAEQFLKLFLDMLPIFEKQSKSRFCFPKIHMLSKYTNDIREKGPVKGYSTGHSERLHMIETKTSTERSNSLSNNQAIKQAVTYIFYRDMIADTYSLEDLSTEEEEEVAEEVLTIAHSNYTLRYRRGIQRIDKIVLDASKYKNAALMKIIKDYVGEDFNLNGAVYGCLTWDYMNDSNKNIQERIKTNNNGRSDYIEARDQNNSSIYYGKVLLLLVPNQGQLIPLSPPQSRL